MAARRRAAKPSAAALEAAERLVVEWWDIDRPVPYDPNPRKNADAVEKVADSIRAYGWRQPIVVDADDIIVVGHTRWLAAKRLGLAEVPVHVALDLTPAEAKAYRLADNRTGEEATWDEALLADELRALQAMGEVPLVATGFDDSELNRWLALELGTPGLTGDDEAPPLPEAPRVVAEGDLWMLGDHRLVVGDGTDPAIVARVLGDEEDVALVWTDPPYNIGYEGKTRRRLKIRNDAMRSGAFRDFLRRAFLAMHQVLAPGGGIYVCHAETEGENFRRAFREAGFALSSVLVWRKDQFVLGRGDYQWQHEPILYGWRDDGPHRWFGDRRRTTFEELAADTDAAVVEDDGSLTLRIGGQLFEISGEKLAVRPRASDVLDLPRPRHSRVHPTMKPVALIERALHNSSQPGDRVLDIFVGSGSMLIACQKLGRVGRAVEIDPAYAEVALERWAKFTGEAPVREDGLVFEAPA